MHPGYVIPDLNTLTKCLKAGQGLSLVPDYLCADELQKGTIWEIWQGHKPTTNTLYFLYRKDATLRKEIEAVKELVRAARSIHIRNSSPPLPG
jgi:DNA-binding transcriptional LysR family regulator